MPKTNSVKNASRPNGGAGFIGERTMPEIIMPIIHMNGTSRDALLEQLCEVYSALGDAMDKLRQAAPDGRDYYPVPGLMERAVEQHRRRQKVLSDLQAEIQEQVRQMEGIGL